MREERMKILAMVESGKISVEEAERLFDALYLSRRIAFEQSFEEFAQNVSRVAGEIGEKAHDAVKAVTPKVVELTKTVVSKTAEAAESISKSVKDWTEKKADSGCGQDAPADGEADNPENREN
jgi:polyhydroxyalkanoate synthesis regulator phasin